MHKIVVCLLSSLLALSAFAEVTSVRGEAPGFEGRLVAVVGVQDEFSGKRIFLGQSEIDDSGFFEVKFEITNTQRIYVHIQRMEAPLFVQPGKSYRVVFPKREQADFIRFDNTEVSLQLIEFPSDDINLVIRKFNADYAIFLRDHFYDFAIDEYRGAPEYLQYKRNKTENVDLYPTKTTTDSLLQNHEKGFSKWVVNFEDSVLASIQPTSDFAFTAAYKRHACAELYLLSGMRKDVFYKRYFATDTILQHNPAFAASFRLFIQNCLVGQPPEIQSAIVRAIHVDRDLDNLSNSISPDFGLLSTRMKLLASIVALKEVYHKRIFDVVSVELLLSKVATGDVLIDSIASASLYQMERCSEGWQMQDFVFSNENQDRWKLIDAEGSPIYFLFFATWSPTSLIEVQVLNRWQEKFKGRVQMIAVCMDDEYKNYRRFLEDNLKLPLTVLYGNAEPFIHEKFNIKSIPHATLLNAHGKVLVDHCPQPSDHLFESIMTRFIETEKEKSQSPRTWKGR
jgi:thiol-disulfide isomerase/thioredoxin